MLFYFVGAEILHINMTSQIEFKLWLIRVELSLENK